MRDQEETRDGGEKRVISVTKVVRQAVSGRRADETERVTVGGRERDAKKVLYRRLLDCEAFEEFGYAAGRRIE